MNGSVSDVWNLCTCQCRKCVQRGHHNLHKCDGDKRIITQTSTIETRYKVLITAYMSGPWSSIIERPVTSVSWDTKSDKRFWLEKIGYGRKPDAEPLLFSKTAAECVAAQIGRWSFAGPGPDGRATARIVPVEVKK